jgi:hypothetical protein
MTHGIGWDERGLARRTGVEDIDRAIGAGWLQEAEDLGLHTSAVLGLSDLGVDLAYGSADAQYSAGLVLLADGARLERGRSFGAVWACTRLPDSIRPGCDGSCRCCGGNPGSCETGQMTCPEHRPVPREEAARRGLLASRPYAG